MHKNENRSGYNNSKVGWIPEDWGDSNLKDCSLKIGSGITPKGGSETYLSEGIPMIRSQNVLDGTFSSDGLINISNEQHEIMKGSALEPNDVLFNITGASIGRCCLFPEHFGEANVNQHVCIVRLKNTCHPKLFVNILNSHIIKRQLHENQAGGGREGLNFQNLGGFRLPTPPLPEQKAIAEVLECWERGIRNLELKIEKKRLIKNGLMQQLLSGKRRLPGFGAELRIRNSELRMGNSECGIPEGWRNVRLGNVFNFVATYAFSRESLTTEAIENTDIYNIHYGDIHATYTGPTLDLSKERRVPMLKTGSLMPSMMDFLQDGDLVMADVSEDYEGIGTCIELKNLTEKRVTGGLHTFVMRDTSKQTVAGFRGYMFKEYRLSKELKRIATGVSVYSLSKTNLSEVDLNLPPLDEQQAIAGVLSAADSEIEALETKLALWKEQKKYLLNNLVTGTIRLPEFRIKNGE